MEITRLDFLMSYMKFITLKESLYRVISTTVYTEVAMRYGFFLMSGARAYFVFNAYLDSDRL